MPRKVAEEKQGKIKFVEKVSDPNGRNVFIKDINLKEINGDSYKQKTPVWIDWEGKDDIIKKSGEREKEIIIEIDISQLNENVNYLFELVASNGQKETTRTVTLSVIFPVDKEFFSFQTSEDFSFVDIVNSFSPVCFGEERLNIDTEKIKFNRKSNVTTDTISLNFVELEKE